MILVLGHTRCGAETAAVAAERKAGGNQGAILTAIRPSVGQARKKVGSGDQEKLVAAAVDENLRLAVRRLTQKSRVIRRLVEGPKVRSVTEKYDLASGAVSWDVGANNYSPPRGWLGDVGGRIIVRPRGCRCPPDTSVVRHCRGE